MRYFSTLRITGILIFTTGISILLAACHSHRKVDFSTEVKPVLNKHCISCHGGVKQNGGFSVLFREEALGITKSGKRAIIPGHPEQSEFIRRLTCKDPKERMPQKGEPLTAAEIEILTKWVEQGAEWGEHWAYIPLKPVAVPDINVTNGNEIDHFIQARLDKEGLKPAPEADKMTLLRRVSLDLTGLPPTPEMASRFAANKNPDAYTQLVDSLLQSPHYGERWASMWLDLARYSDTKGYERDVSRQMWQYRDWVIDAFNKDMPYDTFTIAQLAGDLLPDATNDQLIATAFNRNTMSNDEGGTQDEEFRTAAVMDRVSTTMDVFQGITIACVQCHSHPYDPFHFEDYYKLLAFLNNTRDEDTHMEHPKLRLYDSVSTAAVKEINTWVAQYGNNAQQQDIQEFLKVLEPKVHAHNCDDYTNGALVDTKYLGIRHNGSCRLPKQPLDGKTQLFMNYWTGTKGDVVEFRLDSLKGKTIITQQLAPTTGRQVISMPLPAISGTHDLYLVFRNAAINPADVVCSVEWFAFRQDMPGKGKPGYEKINTEMMSVINKNPTDVPVMIENPPSMQRTTNVFERGNWLVKGKAVTPDVPHSLNPFPANAPRNRLGLAQWMTDTKNPLTARVMVNRCWEQLFGTGIVETIEDFGSQGFLPSHPELLDFLSYKFMHDYKWSMKSLLREIVLSAAYKQDSKTTPAEEEKDPANRLLARGPHFRLTAEEVRDQALAVSGLLNRHLHGPSIMPYQPEGIWQTVWSGEYWKKADDGNQYRRAVYVFQKRTSPYPSMLSFDGSSREVCLQRRIRTNTPLQALVTLNDPVYVETARTLALHMQQNGGTDAATCIRWGYQTAMYKTLPEKKLAALQTLYSQALQQYRKDTAAAAKLVQCKDNTPQLAELAALTIVANAIMNLDEFLTKS
ncbi:carbohydrate binding protein with CBM6 domain [Chitinophaga niastensis]|uniref:Carbohydrate binding protein with CBM6 domain n=1 Tax=Chitinophaga niastensis TaxID=536980 RepID=A0A2P8HF28_CHINA|nr:DUF1553 domain-containing protein [Chitinophaga niastensis]PSL44829.1 carbohydrate binding protein with CBM6 domain [Chitinophaga niastensis]